MKLDVNVPQLVAVRDYHEFSEMGSVLRTLNPELKVKEVGYGEGYVGVIYWRNLPTREQIVALAVETDFYLESLDGEEVEWPVG